MEIRRLIIEEGLSHNEIQLRLNIPPATYFRYLDMLFETEQEAIEGNNYTYQRLLNETLILNQRYLRRARRLEKIANDQSIDAETRIQAEIEAAEFERAVHDMTYMAPSYLVAQGLLPGPELPGPKEHDPTLTMSHFTNLSRPEEKDPSEYQRQKLAGEFRQKNIIRQQNQEQTQG